MFVIILAGMVSRLRSRDAGCQLAFTCPVGRVSTAGSALLDRGSSPHLDSNNALSARWRIGQVIALGCVTAEGDDQERCIGLVRGQLDATLNLLPWKISLSRGDSARPQAALHGSVSNFLSFSLVTSLFLLSMTATMITRSVAFLCTNSCDLP